MKIAEPEQFGNFQYFHIELSTLNNSEFQHIISKPDKPVIVDFWAPWCVPCRVTKPVLEKLAQEYADKIEFLPINADQSNDVLQRYKVIGIPTVLAIRNGKVAARITGAQNEAGYRVMFETLAAGREVKVPMSTFDRVLRLGTGALLVVAGVSTGNWLVLGIGGAVAFLGVYDRCPIWRAITNLVKSKIN